MLCNALTDEEEFFKKGDLRGALDSAPLRFPFVNIHVLPANLSFFIVMTVDIICVNVLHIMYMFAHLFQFLLILQNGWIGLNVVMSTGLYQLIMLLNLYVLKTETKSQQFHSFQKSAILHFLKFMQIDNFWLVL